MIVKSKKWGIFEIVGRPYALEILESLHESPKRYSDLAVFNDKTKTKRLRELEKSGLIKPILKKGKRPVICYSLTEKGEELIEQLFRVVQ